MKDSKQLESCDESVVVALDVTVVVVVVEDDNLIENEKNLNE